MKYQKDKKYYVKIYLSDIFGTECPEELYEAFYVRKGKKQEYYIFFVPYINMEFPFSEEEVIESSGLLNELM